MCFWRLFKKMDPRNFIYTSDYPTPAIVWKLETMISKTSSGTVSIPHNLPFTPLLMGIWSTSSSFNPSYDIANVYGDFDYTGGFTMLNRCDADATNVNLWILNVGGANNDVYFKLFAYAPPDYEGEVPSVDDNTKFILNTDYVVPKIVKQGYVEHTIEGSTEDFSIYHNLGYIPQARIWGAGPNYIGSGSCIEPMRSQYWEDKRRDIGTEVDDTHILIHTEYTGKYYYHIYGDSIDVGS